MAKPSLVFGVTYHGSTEEPVSGLDNIYSKHISAKNLRDQLVWLTQHFTILPIREILDRARQGRLPVNSAFVVFHDGYLGNYLSAFPLLKSMGIRADFCITTGFIGTDRNFWVDVLDAAVKYSRAEAIKIPLDQGEEIILLHSGVQCLAAAQRLRSRLKSLPEAAFSEEFNRIIRELGWDDPKEVPKLGDHVAMCAARLSWPVRL